MTTTGSEPVPGVGQVDARPTTHVRAPEPQLAASGETPPLATRTAADAQEQVVERLKVLLGTQAAIESGDRVKPAAVTAAIEDQMQQVPKPQQLQQLADHSLPNISTLVADIGKFLPEGSTYVDAVETFCGEIANEQDLTAAAKAYNIDSQALSQRAQEISSALPQQITEVNGVSVPPETVDLAVCIEALGELLKEQRIGEMRNEQWRHEAQRIVYERKIASAGPDPKDKIAMIRELSGVDAEGRPMITPTKIDADQEIDQLVARSLAANLSPRDLLIYDTEQNLPAERIQLEQQLEKLVFDVNGAGNEIFAAIKAGKVIRSAELRIEAMGAEDIDATISSIGAEVAQWEEQMKTAGSEREKGAAQRLRDRAQERLDVHTKEKAIREKPGAKARADRLEEAQLDTEYKAAQAALGMFEPTLRTVIGQAGLNPDAFTGVMEAVKNYPKEPEMLQDAFLHMVKRKDFVKRGKKGMAMLMKILLLLFGTKIAEMVTGD